MTGEVGPSRLKLSGFNLFRTGWNTIYTKVTDDKYVCDRYTFLEMIPVDGIIISRENKGKSNELWVMRSIGPYLPEVTSPNLLGEWEIDGHKIKVEPATQRDIESDQNFHFVGSILAYFFVPLFCCVVLRLLPMAFPPIKTC